jgi:hypothetical protein
MAESGERSTVSGKRSAGSGQRSAVSGERLAVSGRFRAVRVLPGLLACLTAGASAQVPPQDTVLKIRPEALVPDTAGRQPLSPALVTELLGLFNDTLTTKVYGPLFLPGGTRHEGPLGVFRGTLRVAGEVVGPVIVINGDLIVEDGALVSGDVLVVGGQIIVRSGGAIQGVRRSFRQPASLVRTSGGLLTVREPPRTLGDIASVTRRLTTGRFETNLSLETGRTYNRVEGLPIVFGPSVARTGLPNLEARLDLRGIAWTAPDQTDRRSDFGYSGRLEFQFGASRRLTAGVHAFRQISPIEEQPLSRAESGWSALLFQRDYRDFFQSQGVSGYLTYKLGAGLRVGTSLRTTTERTVPANDPISIFRNESWRPNPLVDDGKYLSWRVALDYDTRNEPESPSSGWLIDAWWERGRSDNASAIALPPEVRDPIGPGRYEFSRIWVDLRRYARLDPSVRASLRVVAGGWVDGDPLPIQRRVSLGGPDILPGYGFREFNCVPVTLVDPARPALCDRMIATQLEIRTRTRLGLPLPTSDPYLSAAQRLLSIREPDVVIFADAGKSWITGNGPGRIPSDRLPVLREWASDIGFGFDAGGIGVYITQPLTGGRPLTLTARLQRRF